MKTSNLSKSQLLDWINSHTEAKAGPTRRIEDLGNGVAYLFLLSQLHPGCVKLDKMNRNPTHQHEIISNLKLLQGAMERMGWTYKLDMDRLGQMRYQDNYQLACFLFRAEHKELRQNSNNSNQSSRSFLNPEKKIKIVPPEKFVHHRPLKIETEPMSPHELAALNDSPQKKVFQIKCVIEESQDNREKLQKIANILLPKKSGSQRIVRESACQTIQEYSAIKGMSLRKQLTVQESYRRFMRPSLCLKSKFLNPTKQGSVKYEQEGESQRKTRQLLDNFDIAEESLKYGDEMSQSKIRENEQMERQMLLSGNRARDEINDLLGSQRSVKNQHQMDLGHKQHFLPNQMKICVQRQALQKCEEGQKHENTGDNQIVLKQEQRQKITEIPNQFAEVTAQESRKYVQNAPDFSSISAQQNKIPPLETLQDIKIPENIF